MERGAYKKLHGCFDTAPVSVCVCLCLCVCVEGVCVSESERMCGRICVWLVLLYPHF